MTEDTLERHGVRYRFNFLAGISYEDDEGNVWTYGDPEPKWNESDLTPSQVAELDGWVAEHRAARPQDSEMFARWATLEHNGVEHTHRRGKPLRAERPAWGYRCAMCDGYVVNKDPGDYRFIGGPADGQWIVTGGLRTFVVPVIPDLTVSLATDEPTLESLAITTALYERRDDAYWFRY